MIVCAGLSPAWQHILDFEDIRFGEVNRTQTACWMGSGKVLNAALAVERLGVEVSAVTVLGGRSGDAVEEFLRREGLNREIVRSPSPTRVCTTLIERSSGRITELVENVSPISDEVLETFREVCRRQARDADLLIVSGSIPADTPRTVFRDILEGIEVPVIADIRGQELLELLSLRPKVAKPNREELAMTLGRPLRRDDELREAMKHLNDRGAQWVIVSQGAKPLWAYGEDRFHKFLSPAIRAVNPIGSGDALAAGLAVALARGEDMLEAVPYGMAAAVENAVTIVASDIDSAKVEARKKEIQLVAV